MVPSRKKIGKKYIRLDPRLPNIKTNGNNTESQVGPALNLIWALARSSIGPWAEPYLGPRLNII